MKNPICLFLMFLLFSCNKESAPAEVSEKTASDIVELSPEQIKNANIQTAKAAENMLTEVVEVSGIIDVPPQNLVSLSAILGGYLRSVNVLQGTHVRKGEIIAILENPDFINLQQDYLESKAKLQYIKTDYERQQELNQNNIGSKKEFQETESNFKVMEARVHSLAEKIKMLNLSIEKIEDGKLSSKINITSPIDGYVTMVNVNSGSFVGPQNIMFEITDTEHLHAELYVYEKDISKIQKGQKVKISLANDPEKNYDGEVFLINKKIEEDRTVRVHVHFTKHDHTMIPKAFIRAQITVAQKKRWSLPENAIITSENKYYVFVELEKGKYKKCEVKNGIVQNGIAELNILEPLDLQKTAFVTNGAFNLLSVMNNLTDD